MRDSAETRSEARRAGWASHTWSSGRAPRHCSVCDASQSSFAAWTVCDPDRRAKALAALDNYDVLMATLDQTEEMS